MYKLPDQVKEQLAKLNENRCPLCGGEKSQHQQIPSEPRPICPKCYSSMKHIKSGSGKFLGAKCPDCAYENMVEGE